MQLIIMIICKTCGKVKRHNVWVYLSQYQRSLLERLYKVHWQGEVCQSCKEGGC